MNLDLRMQVHPGELWISKQRVHIVLEASKSAVRSFKQYLGRLYALSLKELFCTEGITKPHAIITYFFLSLCLFLSVCLHAVKALRAFHQSLPVYYLNDLTMIKRGSFPFQLQLMIAYPIILQNNTELWGIASAITINNSTIHALLS